jgi:hypothetical protein
MFSFKTLFSAPKHLFLYSVPLQENVWATGERDGGDFQSSQFLITSE